MHHAPQVVLVGADGGDGDRGALPQVVVVDLGHAHGEPLPERGREALHDVALLLQRATPGDPQVEPFQGDQHGRLRWMRANSSTS